MSAKFQQKNLFQQNAFSLQQVSHSVQEASLNLTSTFFPLGGAALFLTLNIQIFQRKQKWIYIPQYWHEDSKDVEILPHER